MLMTDIAVSMAAMQAQVGIKCFSWADLPCNVSTLSNSMLSQDECCISLVPPSVITNVLPNIDASSSRQLQCILQSCDKSI